jgi:hypothetical protein
MAHRKAKAAPKPTHRRHTKETGWLLKTVGQAFSSLVAPLLVGLTLQCVRSHDVPQPRPEAATTHVQGPRSATTSYKVLCAEPARPAAAVPPAVPCSQREEDAQDCLDTE